MSKENGKKFKDESNKNESLQMELTEKEMKLLSDYEIGQVSSGASREDFWACPYCGGTMVFNRKYRRDVCTSCGRRRPIL